MLSYVMPTYFNQMPIAFERGKGVWLWDADGNHYLDALSGIGVCSLGHSHPEITQTIVEQAQKLLHTSNTFRIPLQEQLAERLCDISGMEQVYFCNSGAEANECALKLSRLFARKKGVQYPIVISLQHSFHGRTLATLSATGTPRLQKGFEPLMSSFIHVPINDIQKLDNIIRTEPNVVGIFLECVQGDGGIYSVTKEYMLHIKRLCDEYDLLMMVDEVQTGIGRTGLWFSYQHFDVQPDIVSCAKALGNGIPIGACLARGKSINLFGPGMHGSTFGGNPLACAVGLMVLEILQRDKMLDHVARIGNYLMRQLYATLKSYSCFKGIRGMGLMIGIELYESAMPLMKLGLQQGLLFNVVTNNVIRLLPPFIITYAEADEIVKRLDSILIGYLGT